MSREKIAALRMIGAEVQLVPVAPWTDPNHYASRAMRIAEEMNAQRPASAWFAGQFDNPANLAIHEATTGVEIWEETGGAIDGFACAAGTGGTIAGVGRALKARKPDVRIALADPAGSALANWINTGNSPPAALRSASIGISRLTKLPPAPIDLAWSIAFRGIDPLAHAHALPRRLVRRRLQRRQRPARSASPVNSAATTPSSPCGRCRHAISDLFDPATLPARGIPVWRGSGDRAAGALCGRGRSAHRVAQRERTRAQNVFRHGCRARVIAKGAVGECLRDPHRADVPTPRRRASAASRPAPVCAFANARDAFRRRTLAARARAGVHPRSRAQHHVWRPATSVIQIERGGQVTITGGQIVAIRC